jgi:uncharacterized protein YegL
MTAPQQTKVKCLPTYILIDTSTSMQPVQETLNETLESLFNELIMTPAISDFANVSIITFNTDAHLILGITDIQQLTALPVLECDGVTNFGRAFSLVRECIDRDVEQLNSSGRQVLRPVVFVLTDGQPTDENGYFTDQWRADYDRLVDRSWRRHPNVVPFGFGDATVGVIKEMATVDGAAFLAKDPDNADALRKIFATLLRTLVASAQNRSLQLPEEIDGFVAVNKEVD